MKNRYALISGATSGIGMACAEALAKFGCNLALLGRRKDRLDALKERFSSEYQIDVRTLPCDLGDPTQVKASLEKHQDFLEKTSILINSAGLAKGTESIDEGKTEDWDQMIDVNVKGLLLLTREMLPFLKKQTLADIVNLGSVAGRWVYPGGAVYCATKFAVRAISEGIRMDIAGSGIRVANIEPGMVETEFSLVRLGDQNSSDKVYAGMKPLTPQDIAECITWVLSRPAHVDIQEMVIFPTQQAAVGQVSRDS